VLRELREETGLIGRVERELAVVFKDGRREHYLLVTAEGSIVDRSTLDLEEDAEPVWCRRADLPTLPLWPKRLAWRVAEWAAHGWPAVPVRLTDTVDDLGAPCDW
jgi:8-oxo-dGTP pyrophosphatase MutT (NUDIX family)